MYQILPEFVLVVTFDGEKLLAAPEGQPAAELQAESETKFFAADVDAQLTFVKDDAGNVVAAVLNQGGTELRGEKLD